MKLISRINFRLGYKSIIYSLLKVFIKNTPKANVFGNFFNESQVFLIDSARSGIFIILDALDLPEKSRVGVMSINCHSVYNAIYQAGYTPVFIDVNRDFTICIEDLSNKKNLQVLILSHLFGVISDVEEIKRLYPEMIIIEDCAHSFLSKDKNDNNSGFIADFAVFSFNFGKFPAIGGGGLLLVNNASWYQKIKSKVQALVRPTLLDDVFSAIRKLVMVTIHNPFLYGVFFYKLKKKYSKKSINVFEEHEPTLISNLDLCLLNEKIETINTDLSNQLKNGSFISKKHLSKQQGTHHNYFIIPELTFEKDYWIKKGILNGVEIGGHFSNSILWAMKFGYEKGSCPLSEVIVKQLVTFPCYYALSDKEANKIAHVYQELIHKPSVNALKT